MVFSGGERGWVKIWWKGDFPGAGVVRCWQANFQVVGNPYPPPPPNPHTTPSVGKTMDFVFWGDARYLRRAPFLLFVFYSLHGDKNRKKKHNKKRPSKINKINLANSNMNLWKPKSLSLKNEMSKISLIWYIDIKSYLTHNYV